MDRGLPKGSQSMKALSWAVASLFLGGTVGTVAAQMPVQGQPVPAAPPMTMTPESLPAGVYPSPGTPNYQGYAPQGDPSAVIDGGGYGAPYGYDGQYGPGGPQICPPYTRGVLQDHPGQTYPQDYNNYRNSGAPGQVPLMDQVFSSPGTFFFRAEAFMLRRSNVRPNQSIIRNNSGTDLLYMSDLNFRNEVGQKFDSGYEFNECAKIVFTFWEVQDWFPTNGVTSSANNLTLAGGAGATSGNFTNASSMQASYRTMIKSYEINWVNATIYDRVSLLGGFRYIDMIDIFNINSTRTSGPANLQGSSDYMLRVTDRLLGGQIGVFAKYDYNLWSLEFTGKSGLYDNGVQFTKFFGDNNNTVLINPQANPAATHALSAINEMNLSFSRRLGNHAAVRAGYNAIWLTNVSLAADHFDRSTLQVDRNLNRLGGDLFLHGVNLGLDLYY